MKYILKILGGLFAILLLLLIFFAGFSQTDYFKNGLRSILIGELGKQFNGTIHIGRLDGNFLNNFQLDSVSIFYGNVPVFAVGTVHINYDPISFFQSTIIIDSLNIERPRVTFLRLTDGSWNLGNLLKPSADTSKGRFEKTIALNYFSLRDGIVSLHDSTQLHSDDTTQYNFQRVDYHNFDVTNLDIFLKATIKEDDIHAVITAIRFASSSPKFILENFRGDFHINDQGIKAKDVLIKTTGSQINFTTSLKGQNIFEGLDLPEMEHDTTRLTFSANIVDFAELKQFLPELYFLEGNASLDLDVGGEFGNLKIRRLNLDTYSTSFKIAGELRNLHQPEKLYISAFIGDSKLNPADANKLMPSFHIPPFEHIGQTSLYAQFIGYPSDFRPTVQIKGKLGTFETKGSIEIHDGVPQYQLSLSTIGLDLATITGNTELSSYITASGELIGEGTTTEYLNSELKLDIDTAQIKNFIIDHSKVGVIATGTNFETVSFLNINGATANVNASLDLKTETNPEFAVQLALSSFDVNRFFPETEFATRLNVTTNAKGTGNNLENLHVVADIFLTPSLIKDYRTGEEEIHIELQQKNVENKLLKVESSVADVDMKGRFNLNMLAEELPSKISRLVSRISNHTNPDISENNSEPDSALSTSTDDSLDCTYSINLKNLKPLSSIIHGKPFDAQANFIGRILGNSEQISLSTEGNIDECYLGNLNDGFFIQQTGLNLTLSDLSNNQTLDNLALKILLDGKSCVINSTNVENVNLGFDYHDALGRLKCSGTIDSSTTLRLLGNVSMQPQTYVFDFDSVSLTLNDVYWKNNNDVQVRLNSDGVRVLHALMKHDNESVSLKGLLNNEGDFDMNASIRSLDLRTLNQLLSKPNNTQPSNLSGIINSDFHISGTSSEPVIELQAFADNVIFKKTTIGDVRATFNYKNQSAMIHAEVTTAETDSLPSLLVNGTLPINLSFNKVEKRFPDVEQNIEVQSNGFSVAILEQVVPQMKNLTGTFRGEVLMRGTPPRPMYSGNLFIDDARFIFSPNNIVYSISGNIQPKAEQLVFHNMKIINLTDRTFEGNAIANGYLTLREFKLTDFDVTTNGTVLVMSDSTRKVVPMMYGVLLAETDSSGVRFNGNMERPFLSGNLFVRDANLVFPPRKNSLSDESALTLDYIFIDDTSKEILQTEQSSLMKEFIFASDTAKRNAMFRTDESRLGFLDLLRYDLHVETRGPTRARLIFTPATNEELYTELQGSVKAVNDKGTANIYGEISMTPRSYYNFLKKFDATGTLRFIGQWDNPELNVVATYEGLREKPLTSAEADAGKQPEQQKVVVQIDIKGTRYEPRPELSVKVQEEGETEFRNWATQTKGGDVQSDAISFIVSGKFRDELTSSERADVANNLGNTAGSTVISGVTSTFLSGLVSDFLRREFPFIRSAEVTYSGESFQEKADLRISGELFKGYWRFGGRIFNDIGNANVNYQISLGEVFSVGSIRNLFIELERKVESPEFTTQSTNPVTNAARVYYRISF
ncbi:MAG: hypothetical protein HY960_02855 [Ignavibacteriae bacterium]|nr:hypothetical protein [Ignavibacteriota bacterium]